MHAAQIEEQRAKEAEETGKLISVQQAAQASLKRLAKELKLLEARQKSASETLAKVLAERQETVTKQTDLEISIQAAEDNAHQDKSIQVGPVNRLGQTGPLKNPLNHLAIGNALVWYWPN